MIAGAHVSTRWLIMLSSYWFATSFKWFILLVFLLPDRVAALVPGGEKSAYWGAVFGIGATWAIVGPAIFGAMSDRAGDRRIFVVAGALLTAVAIASLYSAHGLLWLAAAYLLVQVADDLATGPYSATIPELVAREQRGTASGIMSAAMSLSQVAAVLVVLLTGAGEASLYILIVVLNLSTAILVVRLMKSPRPKSSAATGFLEGWSRAWKTPDFRAVWLTRFLTTLAFYLVVPYANFYIRDIVRSTTLAGIKLSSADQTTAMLALAMAIFAAGGGAASGPLIDRLGRKILSVTTAIIMASALAVAALTLPDLQLLLVNGAVFGLGYGAFQAANWAMVSDVLPDPQGLGRDMGLWQMSISSVQLLAGAAGMIVMFGNRLGFGTGYRMLFAFAAMALLAGATAVRSVKGSV